MSFCQVLNLNQFAQSKYPHDRLFQAWVLLCLTPTYSHSRHSRHMFSIPCHLSYHSPHRMCNSHLYSKLDIVRIISRVVHLILIAFRTSLRAYLIALQTIYFCVVPSKFCRMSHVFILILTCSRRNSCGLKAPDCMRNEQETRPEEK